MSNPKLALILAMMIPFAGCKSSDQLPSQMSFVADSSDRPNLSPECLAAEVGDQSASGCDKTNPEEVDHSSQMSVPRAGHTATVLSDGRVLVVGGLYYPYLDSPAEVYDPGTNSWSEVGVPLVPARHAGVSVLLPDGRVLIAGGDIPCQSGQIWTEGNYQVCQSGRSVPAMQVEVFDPKTSTFSLAGRSAHSRVGATLNLLKDGNAILLGGYDFDFLNARSVFFSDGDIFNPVTGEYRQVAMRMKVPRAFHAAVLDQSGFLHISGGQIAHNNYTSRIESYVGHYATSTYELNPFMQGARTKHSAFVLADGQIVLFGGVSRSGGVDSENRAIEYFSSGVISMMGTLPSEVPQYVFATAQLSDSRPLVAGGTFRNWQPLQSVFAYNPMTKSFDVYREMAVPRTNFTLSVLKDGSLLAVGGVNQVDSLDSAERIY